MSNLSANRVGGGFGSIWMRGGGGFQEAKEGVIRARVISRSVPHSPYHRHGLGSPVHLFRVLEPQWWTKQKHPLPRWTCSGFFFFFSLGLSVLICILGILILTQDYSERQFINKSNILCIGMPNP